MRMKLMPPGSEVFVEIGNAIDDRHGCSSAGDASGAHAAVSTDALDRQEAPADYDSQNAISCAAGPLVKCCCQPSSGSLPSKCGCPFRRAWS